MAVPAGSLPWGWGVPAASPACPCLHRSMAFLFWDSLGTPQTPLPGRGSIKISVPVRAAAMTGAAPRLASPFPSVPVSTRSAARSSWTGTAGIEVGMESREELQYLKDGLRGRIW